MPPTPPSEGRGGVRQGERTWKTIWTNSAFGKSDKWRGLTELEKKIVAAIFLNGIFLSRVEGIKLKSAMDNLEYGFMLYDMKRFGNTYSFTLTPDVRGSDHSMANSANQWNLFAESVKNQNFFMFVHTHPSGNPLPSSNDTRWARHYDVIGVVLTQERGVTYGK